MTKGRVVIDTNVCVSANGKSLQASLECQLACVTALIDARDKKVVILDSREEIILEYAAHLHHRGEPGVGDAFFRHVSDNKFNAGKVRLVDIAPYARDVLPFTDPNDRKFLAAALAGKAAIINAVDSDWQQNSALVKALGRTVIELCPDCPAGG